jgi:hypothetical protein
LGDATFGLFLALKRAEDEKVSGNGQMAAAETVAWRFSTLTVNFHSLFSPSFAISVFYRRLSTTFPTFFTATSVAICDSSRIFQSTFFTVQFSALFSVKIQVFCATRTIL